MDEILIANISLTPMAGRSNAAVKTRSRNLVLTYTALILLANSKAKQIRIYDGMASSRERRSRFLSFHGQTRQTNRNVKAFKILLPFKDVQNIPQKLAEKR